MANYSINVTDNADGTWTLTSVLRAPTTAASGGTSLLSDQFAQAATNTTDGLGHKLRTPSEVVERAKCLIASDRAYNG